MDPSPIPHDTYYLETITFQVENRLFKVPRYHFERNSEIHATALTLPAGGDTGVEGSSDENPALYPLKNPVPPMTKEDWISVLKLSTLWRLLDIRALAIERLEADSRVQHTTEGILLGRKYHIAGWLRAGYQALAQEGLTLQDAEVIGWETATRIYALREELILKKARSMQQADRTERQVYNPYSHQYEYQHESPRDEIQLHPLAGVDIEATFAEELQRAESDTKEYLPASQGSL
ncbi:hypothetical protein B0H16DRAFT_1562591 [Mycena metata]|uniref:Uncharacterized protein n=1 Tax=Mycena metata TaxID=1033252 RepID=A0AAD7N2J1_9AGAR|nr:hypothetical protein B0H16DRAFT_1562591 [Mycena metata]